MKIIYISGPVRATGEKTKEDHIDTAKKFVRVFIENKIPYYSPHMNIDQMDTLIQEGSFAWELDFEFLKRSDGIAVLPGWENSNGTKQEIEYAKSRNWPIFYLEKEGCIKELVEYIQK